MLELVILKNYYKQTSNPIATDLFGKIISMKVRGYTRFYPDGVLPVSSHDYICDHVCVCLRIDGELFPVISYKSTPLDICKMFNLNFPVFDLFEKEKFETHYQKLTDHLNKNSDKVVHYDSSLTVDFELVEKYEIDVNANIKAMHSIYHRDFLPKGHFTFAAGTVKFKMDRYYLFWGYKELRDELRILPPVSAKFVDNDKTILYTMKNLSKEALAQLSEHEKSWVNAYALERAVQKKAA